MSALVPADGDITDSGEGRFHYIHDANFNVVAMTDTSWNVKERYTYTPYGEVTILNGASDADGMVSEWSVDADQVSDLANEFLYTGRRLDPGTGLYYYRFRFYHAQLGRFVTRDPIGYEGGMNLQEYVAGRVTGAADPMGLDPGALLPHGDDCRGLKQQISEYETWLNANPNSPYAEEVRAAMAIIQARYRAKGCNQPTVAYYNTEWGALSQGLTNFTRFRPGTIVDTKEAKRIIIGRMWGREPEFHRADCVFRALNLDINPFANNSTYWGDIEDGSVDGYTLQWTGAAFSDINFSIIDDRFQGATCQCDENFVEFLVTIYHEVVGHNVNDIEGHPGNFDDLYEKPVYDAVQKAIENGTWEDICKRCNIGKPVPKHNERLR